MTEQQMACCACLTVTWATVLEGNLTRGWWACKDCGNKFIPCASAEFHYAELRAALAERDELLAWALSDWVEIECGYAEAGGGDEAVVIRLEPGQGAQRIFRSPTIIEALRLAKESPRFTGGESVVDYRNSQRESIAKLQLDVAELETVKHSNGLLQEGIADLERQLAACVAAMKPFKRLKLAPAYLRGEETVSFTVTQERIGKLLEALEATEPTVAAIDAARAAEGAGSRP
jgi:hypothetical protein